MRKTLLLLTIISFIFCACSSDDKDIDVPKTGNYKVVIHNRIDKSKVSQKSDGILYDMYLLSQNGQIYKTGGVDVGKDLEYTLPKDYDSKKILFLILKIGRNSAEAYTNKYYTPEIYYGKPIPIIVSDNNPFNIFIDENTTYSSLKYSYIYEVEEWLSEIVNSLSNK